MNFSNSSRAGFDQSKGVYHQRQLRSLCDRRWRCLGRTAFEGFPGQRKVHPNHPHHVTETEYGCRCPRGAQHHPFAPCQFNGGVQVNHWAGNAPIWGQGLFHGVWLRRSASPLPRSWMGRTATSTSTFWESPTQTYRWRWWIIFKIKFTAIIRD